MKKLISKHALVAIAAGGMLFSSCGDHDMFNPNYKKNEYAANWETKFGKIDPAQDWSMATTVKATANVAGVAGKSILKIYNYSPLAPESRVLGVANLNNGIGEVTFDALKGASTLFVTVEQDGVYKLYGGYTVENGQLNIGNAAKAKTRAGSACPVGKGDVVDFYDKQVLVEPAVTHEETTTTVTFKEQTFFNVVCKSVDDMFKAWEDNGNQYNFPFKEIAESDNVEYTEQIVEYNGKKYFVPSYYFDVKSTTTTIIDKEAVYSNIDINLQYLTNVETKAAQPWKYGWGYQMFGPGSFFQEQKKYYESPKYDNLYNLETLKQIEKGFSIKTMGGEISLPFIYGATQIVDQFGYVFYKDGEDPLSQPHYILMEQGRPQDNIYWDNWKGNAVGEMNLSVWSNFESLVNNKDGDIQCYCDQGQWGNPTGIYGPTGKHLDACYLPNEKYIEAYNKNVYGTEYKLVYFDESGNATYDIPAGLNVVFFICPVYNLDSREESNYKKNDFNYSLPELNKRISHLYGNTESPTFETGNNTEGDAKARGAVKAASWTFKGHTFLGFEDGGRDEDLNDIVFWVEGNFENDSDEPIVVPDPDPDPTPVPPLPDTESQSWILACEDLGSTDDYDFNDIVLEIRHEITYDNDTHDFISSEIQVRCLAAGGTIPANIYYGDNRVGEAHEMLGGQTNQMINTTSYGKPSDWYTVATGVTEDRNILTIDEIIKNISIRVTQNEGDVYATEIKAPETGDAPQMIIVPGDWEWPAERKGIETAYPEFTNWSSNASLTDWNRVKVSDKVVKR